MTMKREREREKWSTGRSVGRMNERRRERRKCEGAHRVGSRRRKGERREGGREKEKNSRLGMLRGTVTEQKEVDSNYTVRTYRLYLVIVGGHHNPRSNITTIETTVILHSRGRSCKKRETTASRTSREDEEEEEHVWTYLRIRQRWHYPETGMTPLASRCDETTTLLLLLLLELAPGARCYSRAAATSASSLPR
ncbi:hypothetical protein ALC57_14898 [Trachymyrmex cornetzi]|uniref:Uncharacterized protein n=1 Tax=Trachymyrmex cornetzi TaxID=471704 RepID=A0A195DIW8_9HYME|nr:hypothetical protein ALC57_14898 [Trachymyrmex cornetzi]